MSQFPIIEEPELNRITGGQGLVLLDFWQASCAPCLALEPRLERFASAYPGAFEGHRIDVDAQPDIVERYGVMSIPTIIALRDGRETARLDGLIRDSDLSEVLIPELFSGGAGDTPPAP